MFSWAATWTWECHIQLINLSFKCLCVLLVYHCKLTDSSGYWQLLHALHAPKSLNMYFLHRLLALLTCAWYAAVSYLSYTTSLILQAHARPHYTSCQSSVLLFPGSHSAFCQWQKESYHSSFTRKATVQTQVISGATIWSGQQIDYTQAYPNCGDGGVYGTTLKTPGDKLRTLNLASFLPCFHVLYWLQTEEQKRESLGTRLQQTFL